MRLGKLPGANKRKSMPIGPHRTETVPVNVRDLERVFDDGADVTLEALVEKGLIKNTRIDVKVLGHGDLKKKLTVTAHAFSKSAGEKIEAAGGSATALRPPREIKKKHRRKAKPAVEEEPEETEEPEEPAGEGQSPPEDAAEPGPSEEPAETAEEE
jgi:ribosomal protein L18E